MNLALRGAPLECSVEGMVLDVNAVLIFLLAIDAKQIRIKLLGKGSSAHLFQY